MTFSRDCENAVVDRDLHVLVGVDPRDLRTDDIAVLFETVFDAQSVCTTMRPVGGLWPTPRVVPVEQLGQRRYRVAPYHCTHLILLMVRTGDLHATRSGCSRIGALVPAKGSTSACGVSQEKSTLTWQSSAHRSRRFFPAAGESHHVGHRAASWPSADRPMRVVLRTRSQRWRRELAPGRKSTRLNSSHLGISY